MLRVQYILDSIENLLIRHISDLLLLHVLLFGPKIRNNFWYIVSCINKTEFPLCALR